MYYCSDGLDVTLSSISARMAWEEAFDRAYIKPTLEVSLLIIFAILSCWISQHLEANVQKAQQTIMNDSGHGTVWNYILSLILLFSFRSWEIVSSSV